MEINESKSTEDSLAAQSTAGIIPTRRGMYFYRELLANVVFALFFARLVYQNCEHMLLFGLRFSLVVFTIKVAISTGCALFRKFPKEVSISPFEWIMGFVGSFSIYLLVPEGGADYLFFQILQLIGLAIQILALASLNRSLGIVPANRGVKTSGLYTFIRHPLYAGYFVGISGFLANNFSSYNIAVFGIWLIVQGIRMHREEIFLKRDPEYLEYTERTRWRIIPFVY